MAMVAGWDGNAYDDGRPATADTMTTGWDGNVVSIPSATDAASVAGIDLPYLKWNGQAGSQVEYLNSDGKWVAGGAPEHAESAGYVQKAVSDPQVQKLFEMNSQGASLNNEQQAFFHSPTVGLDSYGQGSRWGAENLFDDKFNPQQAGVLIQTGGTKYLSAADQSAGAQFNQNESPAAQAARNGSGGLLGGGFGGLLLSVGLGIMTAGTSLAAELGAIGTGALVGGVSSALTGGDPLKGALLGGFGGAIGQYASTLEGGVNAPFMGNADGSGALAPTSVISPSGMVNYGGKALLGVASGQEPGAAIVGAGASMAGAAVGQEVAGETGSNLAGKVASGVASGLIGTALTPSATQQTKPTGVNAATAAPAATSSSGEILPVGSQVFQNLRQKYQPQGSGFSGLTGIA